MNMQNLKYNPASNDRKIEILRSLGLREDEIRYLTWIRLKQEISSNWNRR